ncbi:MAG TPA: hypothetical protein VHZ28_01670 [Terracidiphilus sp.]|jgi:uncharacterized protein (DUF4415 family)|nr:hypothetical protein [Terracidiphilus sp.]
MRIVHPACESFQDFSSRSKGDGHLTRINDILTNLMEAEHRTAPRKR